MKLWKRTLPLSVLAAGVLLATNGNGLTHAAASAAGDSVNVPANAEYPGSIDKADLLELLNGGDLSLLRRIAMTTTDPEIEQTIDAMLVKQHGDKEAAERLYASGMSNGFKTALHGTVEKFLIDLYPEGELAQGIKRYEAVRGRSYFYTENPEGWYKADGKDFDQPRQAIEGWLDFIKDYPLHPAADDAAYRLARCYQMLGQFEQALYWFNQSTQLGDRDITYDAAGHFLYVLDVEMTSKDFAQLDSSRLPEWSKPWIAYSQAVEWMRDRDYIKAAEALKQFIVSYDGQDLFMDSFGASRKNDGPVWGGPQAKHYPFWDQVKEQLSFAEQMAQQVKAVSQAAGAERASKQYDLAAFIYHQPLMYYNHLWRGERQSFFWFGQIKFGDYDPALDRYVARFNHLVQAADAFSQIDLSAADPQTGAKTLFSKALSYSKLIDYGVEVGFYDTKTHLGKQLIEACQALIARYPDSSLADDAMMLIYHYTHSAEWLEKLVKRYPNGDQAEAAEALLAQVKAGTEQQQDRPNWFSDPLRSYPLSQKLDPDDWRVPAEVKRWVENNEGTGYHGTKSVGDWLYVYVSAGAGKRLTSLSIYNDLRGTHLEYYTVPASNGENWHYKADWLIRLPARFVEKNPVWEEKS